MPRVLLRPESSVLVVIDVQQALLPAIHEVDRVVGRSSFLIQIARLLDVPVLATEQNPSRMGGTAQELGRAIFAEIAALVSDNAGGASANSLGFSLGYRF